MTKFLGAVVCAVQLLACAPEPEQSALSASEQPDAGRGAMKCSPQPVIEKEKRMLSIQVAIASSRGQLRAELADNAAARALVKMLPLDIRMRDHLRQEKTGSLPGSLPGGQRQTAFSPGTLGIWGDRDFVIYYREGRVPAPGIVVLGRVRGDVSLFDNPDPITISLRRTE